MKKFLLLTAMLAIAGFGTHLKAQCAQSNLTAIIKSITSVPGGCQVMMDINFTGNFNNGNKFAFIHLWESSPVDHYPNLGYGNPPTAAELANAVTTIVVKNPGSSSAALYNQYLPDTGVPVSYTGVGFSKSGSTYTLTNVVINLTDCNQPVIIKGDVWSSQASDAQVVHCFNRGTITMLLSNSLLPVTFKSFTAGRNNSAVVLKWETASEQNNLGFAIERNTNGAWQQLSFVPSQAAGGNSSNVLSYQYNDPNANKGVSQYRIRQVDIDSRFTYSEVRSVRGEGQIGKTLVYPNPSSNGKVNVVFEETGSVKDVSLVDLSGRVVKQWNAISNNNIEIDNLAPGMYSLRTVLRETGEQSVNKIIVNSR
jgi:type IX secretion system substrate protein